MAYSAASAATASYTWATLDEFSEPTHPNALLALQTATDILTALSGHRYGGVWSITEMYDTQTTLAPGAAFYSLTRGGVPFMRPNVTCNSCGVVHRVRLRGQPVRRLIEVSINDRRLLPSEYVLLDHAVVGLLADDVCGAGCLTVQYEYGMDPPISGKFAALKLAEELLKSLDPNEDCDLPQRVTTVSRQGMTWTLLDPQDFLDDGRTGIYEIDLFLRSVNPARALRPAKVFSVDRPRASTVVQEYPPLAAVLLPDDLVVVPGVPAGWSIRDPQTVAILSAGHHSARLLLETGEEFTLPVTTLGARVNLRLTAAVTAHIGYGMRWQLFAHDLREPAEIELLTGEARTL